MTALEPPHSNVPAPRGVASSPARRERGALLAAIVGYATLSGFGTLVLPHLMRRPEAAVPLGALIAALAALAVLPAAVLIEVAVVGWRRSSLRQLWTAPTASMKTDAAFLALSHVQFTDIAGKMVMLGAAMVVGLWVRGWIFARTGVELGLPGLATPLQVAAYFALFTFLDYWAHRLYHSRVFWPLHRFHHAARDFSVINSVRAHPAAVLGNFVVTLPLAILGASPLVVIWANALAQGLSLLIHSRIDSDWGWFGRWVLQSPNHHRAHHKRDIAIPTGNFSLAPIWDRLFGTWDAAAGPDLEIGVDTAYRHGLWIWPDIWRDFRDFCAGVVRTSRQRRRDSFHHGEHGVHGGGRQRTF